MRKLKSPVLIAAMIVVVLLMTTSVLASSKRTIAWGLIKNGVKASHAPSASKCYRFEILSLEACASDLSECARIEWKVTTRTVEECKYTVSYIAFGTEGLAILQPPDGAEYVSSLTGPSFMVSHTKMKGKPGFPSIKFEFEGDKSKKKDFDFCCGVSEVFVYEVKGYKTGYTFTVQAHNGIVYETLGGISIQD